MISERWRSDVSLAELCDVRAGYWGASAPDAERPVPVQVVRNGDIDRAGEIRSSAAHFFSAVEAERSRVRPGDLLLTSSGDIGKAAIAQREGLFVSNFVKRLRPRGGVVLPAFLRYLMQHPDVDSVIDRHSGGSTIRNLRASFFAEPWITLPPLDQQQLIVDLLEEHLSRSKAALGTLESAVLRGEALRNLTRKRVFDDLSGAHGTTPLLVACSIANGQTPKGVLSLVRPDRPSGALPYFKVGDMNVGDGKWMSVARFYISPAEATSVGLTLRPAGTVLLPKRGGAIATNKKRMLREPSYYDLNTMGLVPGDGLESSYLWHWLRSVDLESIADGSNVPQINATQVRGLSLPVPSVDVQREVVVRLDASDQAIDRLKGQLLELAHRGEQLRLVLLASALSGKLTNPAATPEGHNA